MLNEVKFDREDKITSDFSHMWNQKKQKQMNIRKWKQVQRYREKTWFPQGQWLGRCIELLMETKKYVSNYKTIMSWDIMYRVGNILKILQQLCMVRERNKVSPGDHYAVYQITVIYT